MCRGAMSASACLLRLRAAQTSCPAPRGTKMDLCVQPPAQPACGTQHAIDRERERERKSVCVRERERERERESTRAGGCQHYTAAVLGGYWTDYHLGGHWTGTGGGLLYSSSLGRILDRLPPWRILDRLPPWRILDRHRWWAAVCAATALPPTCHPSRSNSTGPVGRVYGGCIESLCLP